MSIKRGMLACVLALLAAGQARHAAAGATRCFDFGVPTVERLFVKEKVQRLVIWVGNPGREVEQAAASLAAEAKKRGLDVVILTAAEPAAGGVAETRAYGLCKDQQAQLVATVRFLTGKPGRGVVDFEDATGQKVGSVVSWESDEPACSAGGRVSEASSEAPLPPTTWYGWQLAIADALSFSVLFTHGEWPYLATYVFVPAAFHIGNGRGDRILPSIGLRTIPILFAAALGFLTIACREGNDHPETCGDSTLPFAITAVIAAIVEDFFLAHKPRVPAPSMPSPSAAPAPGLALGVGFIPYRQGAGIGVSGRF